MFNFFEHPWGLTSISIITILTLFVFQSMYPEKCRRWLWFIPALLVIAAFGIDYLVETDREKIDTVIASGARAVEKENADSIEPLIADNYRDSYHGTKNALMNHCRRMFSERLFGKNIARIVSLDIQPPEATIIFTVRVLFDPQSYVYQNYKQQLLAEIEAELQKQSDGQWLLSRIELVKIDFHPANWAYTEQANQ